MQGNHAVSVSVSHSYRCPFRSDLQSDGAEQRVRLVTSASARAFPLLQMTLRAILPLRTGSMGILSLDDKTSCRLRGGTV